MSRAGGYGWRCWGRLGPYARQGRQTARKSLDSKVCLVPDVQICRYRCHQRAGALAQQSKGTPSAWPSSYPSEVIQGAPAVAVPDLQRHASEQLALQAPAKLTMAGLVSLARPPGSASPSHRGQAVPEFRVRFRWPARSQASVTALHWCLACDLIPCHALGIVRRRHASAPASSRLRCFGQAQSRCMLGDSGANGPIDQETTAPTSSWATGIPSC